MFLLLPVALAEDCAEPLRVRSTRPQHGDIEVPVDARVLASFIGWGSLDEVQATLRGPEGELAHTQEGWCYEHEGPHEVHCWLRLSPAEPLAALTEHTLVLSSTELWGGEGVLFQETRFTTGEELAASTAGPPSLQIASLDLLDPEECDYEEPQRFWLDLLAAEVDPSGLSVFHVDQSVDGSAFQRVHTLHLFEDSPDFEAKQFLDGATEACFQVSHEDAAGRQTPGQTACWPVDTGQPDSPADSPTDSSAGQNPTDTDPPPVGVPPDPSCGCASSSTALWLLPGLLVLALGRRRR